MTFLENRARGSQAALLLAHGAGAPMDTPFMNVMAKSLCGNGLSVSRFEFAYMAERRDGGAKRPPPRVERLVDEYWSAVEALPGGGTLFIGGKSLGGRVASLIAQELYDDGRIAGLVCLGYPFHPPGKLGKLRTAHLMEMTVPALIVQGERDAFGNRQDVESYELPPAINVHWATDGDHDLKPRKRSGLTAEQNWSNAAAAVCRWISGLNNQATARV